MYLFVCGAVVGGLIGFLIGLFFGGMLAGIRLRKARQVSNVRVIAMDSEMACAKSPTGMHSELWHEGQVCLHCGDQL